MKHKFAKLFTPIVIAVLLTVILCGGIAYAIQTTNFYQFFSLGEVTVQTDTAVTVTSFGIDITALGPDWTFNQFEVTLANSDSSIFSIDVIVHMLNDDGLLVGEGAWTGLIPGTGTVDAIITLSNPVDLRFWGGTHIIVSR